MPGNNFNQRYQVHRPDDVCRTIIGGGVKVDSMQETNRRCLSSREKKRTRFWCLRGGRSEYGKQIRKKYEAGEINARWSEIKQYDPRTDGLCNTITTVQKDCEILVCSTKRKRSRASDIPEERPTNKTEV